MWKPCCTTVLRWACLPQLGEATSWETLAMAIHLLRAAPSLWHHEVDFFGQVDEGLIRVSVLQLDQLCFGWSVFGGITEGGPFLGWSI